MLDDYYYTIALNGLAIVFAVCVYHIKPMKCSKIKYLIEYALLACV